MKITSANGQTVVTIPTPVPGFDAEDLSGSFAIAAGMTTARLIDERRQGSEVVLTFAPSSPALEQALEDMGRQLRLLPATATTTQPPAKAAVVSEPSTPAITVTMTGAYERIHKILSSAFVFVEEVARVLALAFSGRKNVIIFGPAGHGKSEMVKSVIDGLGLGDETFVQFFGEGMDEARLFGGLNFAKLEAEKVLEYFPEKSFLNSRVAVFEELFDAPASVLLALKDVLTARELRNGAQRFQMRTEVIICLTNKEPSEVSELGAAAHALIERFPLQLNLRWKDYSSKAYLAMFEKVAARLAGPVLNGFKAVLAEILAKATAEGNFVSPRTAVHAFQVCQASASMRGATHVEKQDLTDLRFLPGLEGLAQTIEEDLARAMKRAEAQKRLEAFEANAAPLLQELNGPQSPIKYLQLALRLQQAQDEAAALKVSDDLVERRKQLRDKIASAIPVAQQKALEATRI